jgi:putative serine protease PepD
MHSSARSRLHALMLTSGALLALSVAVSACSSAVTPSPSRSNGNAAVGAPLQDSYEAVVRAVLPSVVQISASDSTGSGVVYDDEGDIVTNAHVVGTAKTVEVLPASGMGTLPADVVGVFKPDDLAVIRVTKDASSLRPAKFTNSDDASIGELVLAMGNPLGLTDSVTQGIISATGRTVSASEEGGGHAVISSAIQTSAAINPGNSGGALVTLGEEVIGIPTLAARLPDQGGAAPGIGFAIPSNTVMNIAGQLIRYGRVKTSDRASLDIAAQTAANSQGENAGVAIVEVTKGGAADSAGLRPGDIILELDGKPTQSVQVLDSILATMKPGSKVSVKVQRDGSVATVTVTLGSLGT